MVKTIDFKNEIDLSIKEILRYLGSNKEDNTTISLIEECIPIVKNEITYKVCYLEFDVSSIVTTSSLLKNYFKKCDKAILFAATLGIAFDRLINTFSHTEPSKALIIQAIGAERIEALCDEFQFKIKEKYPSFQQLPRISAGYGDWDIGDQKLIFKALDCNRKIGLTLNSSMLMSPSKSVTGIIGLKEV